jgi:magnesium transporter
LPGKDLKKLLERIHTRLDESSVGISQLIGDLGPADLAEVINELTLVEAATVVSMLPVNRAVDLLDNPFMRRRAAILEHLELDRVAEFVRLQPAMNVGEALKHIRSVASEKESIYACYVMEPRSGHLLGAVSLRDLVMADLATPVTQVMRQKPVTVNALDDQEDVAKKIAKYNLLAVPVLEKDGDVVGFVTVDDVIDVMTEEGTEDILRLGAIEPGALDKPYMQMSLPVMIRKRAGWLVILFLGEMLTATAMGFFEKEIARAVVLALFVPLIISSGGNSGSQASTLVIRALALGEVTLSDWWRVMRREVFSGLGLGLILGTIGFLRITVWSFFSNLYGPHWPLVALTVGIALIGIVLWGTLAGSMLPFVLRRLGFDPATSSAPFVATLVDVTGLIIYFTVAVMILRGTLL